MEQKPKRKTTTSTAVKSRYNAKTYDRIVANVPKDLAARFKQKCADTGTSQAQIVKEAIENFLAK